VRADNGLVLFVIDEPVVKSSEFGRFICMPEGMSDQTPAEDDIDRQLRELTEGRAGSARYSEPSAAQRAKAAEQARKQGKARAREAGRRDRRMARRSGGRRRATQALSWTIAIVVLAAAVGLLSWRHHALGIGSTAAGGTVSNLNPATAGPPADPFAGTPADQWADGAAGILIPAAKPVGPFSAAQVAAAYTATKRLLIAETLDKQTLEGGAPTAFIDLLTPSARSQFLSGLNVRGAYPTGQSRSSRSYVESFAPGTAQLIGSVIKVKGSMSAQTYRQSGMLVLAINVSDLVTYPIERPGQPGTWMRVVADVYGFFAFAHWDNQSGSLQPWEQTIVANSGVQCPMTDGWVHPVYPSLGAVPASGSDGGNPYTPISVAPSALPTAVPTKSSACSVSGGST
jgi:hypothetical protein